MVVQVVKSLTLDWVQNRVKRGERGLRQQLHETFSLSTSY